MEHLNGAPNIDNVVVEDSYISEISPTMEHSSIIEHFFLVVQHQRCSIVVDRARR